jgi:hypothetical protein
VRQPPTPPWPDFVRRPQAPFGWLEAHLLHDRWLAQLGPDAIAVLLLLALAADRRGASFYSRGRMGEALAMDVGRVGRALDRLLELDLVALRPWRSGGRDGVWQLLPVERQPDQPRGGVMHIAELLRSLGFDRDQGDSGAGAK